MKLRPTSTQAQTLVNLAFDIETDGINSSCIHCIVTQDLDTGQVMEYNDQSLTNSVVNGVCALNDADNLVSHNGIMFDIPEIKKHYPFFENKTWDTLILSRFFHPDMLELDLRRKWAMMPARLMDHTALKHTVIGYGVSKITLERPQTGKTGHKKCKTTVKKTLLSSLNYGNIFRNR